MHARLNWIYMRTLYTPDDEDAMSSDVRAALVEEFGPMEEAPRTIAADPTWQDPGVVPYDGVIARYAQTKPRKRIGKKELKRMMRAPLHEKA